MPTEALEFVDNLFFGAVEGQGSAEIVDQAYSGLLGYDLGNVAQARKDYWIDQLDSGAVEPENFASTFLQAANADQGTEVSDNDHAANQAVVAAHLAAIDDADDPEAELDLNDLIALAAQTRQDTLDDITDPDNGDPDNGDPVDPDDVIMLGVGQNIEEGGAENTLFNAPQAQTESGPVANTLSTGDSLDGGGGTNRLEAQLASETGMAAVTPVAPTTTNIDEVQIDAVNQDLLGSIEDGEGFFGGQVTVNAANMEGVTEWTSYNSQSDLTIQNLTTQQDTEDVTIRMDHTGNEDGDFSASDFTALFDQNHLLAGQIVDDSRIVYETHNQDGHRATDGELPLISTVFGRLWFELEGEEYRLNEVEGFEDDDTTGEQIQTHEDMAEAMNDALDVLRDEFPDRDELTDVEAFVEGTFEDTQGLESPAVVLSAPGEFDLGFSTANPNQSVTLNQADQEAEVDGVSIPSDDRYDVARVLDDPEPRDLPVTATIELEKAGKGSNGGFLTVGGMSSSSNSTDIEVFNVAVQGDSSKPSNLAGMGTKTNNEIDVINIETDYDGDGDPADLVLGNGNAVDQDSGQTSALPEGLSHFDATDLEGDLWLGSEVYGADRVATDGGRYDLGQGDNDARFDALFGADDVTVTAQGGDDVIDLARARADTSVDIDGGDNTVHIEDRGPGNGRVSTGDGDDEITFSGPGATDGWDVRSGGGDDVIRLPSGFDDVPDAASITFGDDYLAFDTRLVIEVDGVESEVVEVNSDAGITTADDLHQAVQEAIDSRVALANMLIPIRDGNDLDIHATNGVNGEVNIDWFAPLYDDGDLQAPVDDDGTPRSNTNAWQSLTGQPLYHEAVDAGDINAAWQDWFPGSSAELTDTSADNLGSATGAQGLFAGPGLDDYEYDDAGNAGEVVAAMQERLAEFSDANSG